MKILSLRFISVEYQFSYRLALEIAAIVTLLIAVSGAINGVSIQFASFLTSSTGTSNGYFLVSEHSKVYEDSYIPYKLMQSIDLSYVDYFTPFLAISVNMGSFTALSYFFVNLTNVLSEKSNFIITAGNSPRNQSDILIGKGLAAQLGISNELPVDITIEFNNTLHNRTITGIFDDASPWYYGFLDDLTNYWSNLTYVSGFEFQIKNIQEISIFEQQISDTINKLGINISLSYTALEQTEQLTVSFYSELEVLFTYLLDFLSILLFLKLFHSGYTLLQRFRHEFFICKLIGMSNWQLELLFLQIILLIGNIGVFLGFFIGIVFPEMLVLILKAILNSSSLYLIPSLNDMIVVLIISNSIFFVTSYLAFKFKKNMW